MHRKSAYHITLDLARSHGAWLYDQGRQAFLLDLFGLYASLPLGYRHPIFEEPAFREEILAAASVKIPNNEMATEAGERFLEAFSRHPAMRPFTGFHFTCTGALAVEAALKAARDYRGSTRPRLLAFKESFHGINGYGGLVTDRFGSVRTRLDGFPGPYSERLDNPVIRYRDGAPVADAALRARVLAQVADALRGDTARDIVAVLVEPIQCTAGDQVFDPEFLRGLRGLCTQHDVPLIFDEVQTGFGGTGSLWYFEQLGVVPDLVAFGKKTQVSGIMVREPFGTIFRTPVRLEVTWDGDLLDMIRCRFILEAYRRFQILEHVRALGPVLAQGLRALPGVRHVRQVGLLIAFDFDTRGERDAYVRRLLEARAIVLSTQERTVRWRPHLALTAAEAQAALTASAAALAPQGQEVVTP